MTHEQLIAKAREHAAVFERGLPYHLHTGDFDRVTVRETVIVRFDRINRDDHIEIYLDRSTGDFVTAEYVPPQGENEKK